MRRVLAMTLVVVATMAHAAEPNRATGSIPGTSGGNAVTGTTFRHEPVAFSGIPGWGADDPRMALVAFKQSCRRLGASPPAALEAVCRTAAPLEPEAMTADAARAFFEARFQPHRVIHGGSPGLLTGYYEPVMDGNRGSTAKFNVPVYRRPPELVNLVDESRRGTVGQSLTHAAATPAGPKPFATRAEIEAGALAGRNLELMYFADPVDVFFLHIQGSGRVRLPDGQMVRITYDGKNGHPYTSIGRHLIDSGEIGADRMSLGALGTWLKADRERGRRVMQTNHSFVFFREMSGPEAEAAQGVNGIPLTEGRSLAVDTSVHAIGTPIYVDAPALTHGGSRAGEKGFSRLMIAQDVGSAIRGPERGDIYFGSGDAAGQKAGITKHPGTFYVLLPRTSPLAGSIGPAASAIATGAIKEPSRSPDLGGK